MNHHIMPIHWLYLSLLLLLYRIFGGYKDGELSRVFRVVYNDYSSYIFLLLTGHIYRL